VFFKEAEWYVIRIHHLLLNEDTCGFIVALWPWHGH
jgi:hypothetical protein